MKQRLTNFTADLWLSMAGYLAGLIQQAMAGYGLGRKR